MSAPGIEGPGRWDADLQRAREELTLEELLRRCHRDELLPLCQVLHVNPQGLGTGKLARVCAWTLRRAGGHELANLLQRGGEGPGYPQVLRELAARTGAPTEPTLERTELSIVAAWLRRERSRMSADQQAQVEAVFGEAPAALVPAGPLAAPDSPPSGRLLAAGGALRVLPLFVPILAPAAMAAGAWWLGRPKDDLLLPAVLEVARLRQVVRHRVTVGVVGSPSSGKDAAIKAIFGVDTGNVHPVAGSTKEVAIIRLRDASALFVVNTPGMGDVVQAVTEEARQILHHIDVFVYVVNAQGGVQARELADYRGCLSTGRPVLAVINKIDTLRPRDRERYLADARGKLGAPEEDFLAAAFDPLPQLSPTPLGVDEVQDWITHHLVELGKDPTELPWVPTELDGDVAPPGATWIEEPPVPDGPLHTPSPDATPTVVPVLVEEDPTDAPLPRSLSRPSGS
ncbi:GTPase domain-containing protein [Myxococcota bacterium]|nr:GTPase domain-containing protein [Myxococcota bacterium]